MEKNALVLSGGGSRGGYEIGVWQALRELGVPIHIVTGTSVGALNGAMVAQDDFELAVDLWKELETHMVFDLESDGGKDTGRFDFEIAGMTAGEAIAYAKEILTRGGAGTSGLEKIVQRYVSEEKIRGSDIKLGVVTVEFPTMKPHYLFAEDIPQGKLPDYILASASCFPAVQAREIDGIRYIDGGYVDVMPVELALKQGADNIIAVHLEAAGFVRQDTVELAEETASKVIIIKSHWDLGNFLIFDTDNTRRIIRLGYLDTMKAFGVFEGKKFTFSKGELTPHQRSGAEAAARILKLDPAVIYKKTQLHSHLRSALSKVPTPDIRDIRTPEDARRKLNEATLMLYIADRLAEKGSDSFFAGRSAFKLFKEEILAADYLLVNELLDKKDIKGK
ncbi:patatin-like phospholipase family protein [Anaerovorax odorimutans]|uniref:Patatin-like phospholipase family protein n=1 Tax=Anaerovorax odorimutans TaxID=109327 RepID=A0ABT1RNM3_9FIRM|nr:patatin-like phospholipase family protein [Anaerovorax odorimutans]MCQ4636770.1 patatin-like phospholipase family protein [Anaerovorax odorimutans]